MTRALRGSAAGSELAVLDHEPERRLRRQRKSLNGRLELEGEERPIVQPHEQQIERRGPEAFGDAWIYVEEVVRGIIDRAVPDSESKDSSEESGQEEEARATEEIEAWGAWAMEEGNAGYGYQGPRFEFGMCTYDTSDNIRRYIGANRRKHMLPDGTIDNEQANMVILTCVTSTVASRLEAAVDMDCRPRDADENAAAVRRDFMDANTTWMQALLGFGRLIAPPDAVAHACEAVGGIKHKPWNHDLIRSTANKIDNLGTKQGKRGTWYRQVEEEAPVGRGGAVLEATPKSSYISRQREEPAG